MTYLGELRLRQYAAVSEQQHLLPGLKDPYFSIKDRKTLYNGWILGSVYSNCLPYHPFITKGQQSDIQVAMNSRIRAILNIPRFGKQALTEMRKKLKISNWTYWHYWKQIWHLHTIFLWRKSMIVFVLMKTLRGWLFLAKSHSK